MVKRAAFALAALAAGCAPATRSSCQGLVYSEAGLTREQYRPCAAEMVKQLDRAQNAVETMADKNRDAAARMSAKRDCLAATSDLTHLLRAAGGSTKLMARWDDTKLNSFNYAVMAAKDYFAMVCYYGPKPFEKAGAPLTSGTDPNHAQARQILAEIR